MAVHDEDLYQRAKNHDIWLQTSYMEGSRQEAAPANSDMNTCNLSVNPRSSLSKNSFLLALLGVVCILLWNRIGQGDLYKWSLGTMCLCLCSDISALEWTQKQQNGEKKISTFGWDSCSYPMAASNAKELWSEQGYSLPHMTDVRYLTQKTLVQLCITGCGKTKLFITLSLLPKRKPMQNE